MLRPVRLFYLGLLATGVILAARPSSESVQAHRNRGKAYYERGEYAQAVQEFLKVLEAENPEARDHFNAGMSLLQIGDYERALAALTTARQVDPSLLDVDFGLALLYKRQLRYPPALDALSKVVARDPQDSSAWLNLGVVAASMGKAAEAQTAFEKILAMGFPVGRNFYLSALFRQATLLSRQGKTEEAQKLFSEFQALRQKVPSVSLTPQALENGRHSQIQIPLPSAEGASGPLARPEFSLLTELVFAEEPCANAARPSAVAGDYDRDGLIDLFVTNPCGLNRLFRNQGGGRFTDVSADVGLGESAGGLGAVFLDPENSGRVSLLVLHGTGNRFYSNRDGRFIDRSERSGFAKEAAGLGASAMTLDFDSDGLIDLFLTRARPTAAIASGAVLYRNNGDGRFRDVSGESGLRAAGRGSFRTATAADFDDDGLPDLAGISETGTALLLRNLGSGRFQASPLALGSLDGRSAAFVEAGDFNQDGWFDILLWGERASGLLVNQGKGRFQALADLPPFTAHRDGFALYLDANADGYRDLLWRDTSGNARLLASRGRDRFEEIPVALPPAFGPAFSAGLEGNGATDLVIVGADGRARIFRRRQPATARWLGLSLAGDKSNRQAVGAVVEVKAGNFYQKLISRGLPLLVYTGGSATLDVVRVTWSNGVVQNEVQVSADRRLEIIESDRQTSSCPFLYIWDGERFRFLTDVVGRAPLGEPLPDGSVVEPNPEDYLRIPPDRMKLREGRHVFQVTEELREIAYLDRVELLAVDHPEGAEIYTDERFSAPPFEPFRLYEVTEKRVPHSATNHRGEDVLARVARADGLAAPVEPRTTPGLAEEHALLLDPGEVGHASSLRLFLTGWVYWASSSGMRALSTNAASRLRPPSLQVRDGSERWVTVIENLGLPSGIGRTLVADLTGKFLSEDRSVRIVTNLRVYWDEAFFATGDRSAPPSVERLRIASADLHYRGFSLPILQKGRPDFYDYGHLLAEAPWNAAPGHYTRFSEVTSLLEGADSRLVVMAPGDELTLTFDPAVLPPPAAGFRRDFILHFTGWAKDNEPNTLTGRSVEPLPFIGMPGYPFPLARPREEARQAPLLVPPLALLRAR